MCLIQLPITHSTFTRASRRTFVLCRFPPVEDTWRYGCIWTLQSLFGLIDAIVRQALLNLSGHNHFWKLRRITLWKPVFELLLPISEGLGSNRSQLPRSQWMNFDLVFLRKFLKNNQCERRKHFRMTFGCFRTQVQMHLSFSSATVAVWTKIMRVWKPNARTEPRNLSIAPCKFAQFQKKRLADTVMCPSLPSFELINTTTSAHRFS